MNNFNTKYKLKKKINNFLNMFSSLKIALSCEWIYIFKEINNLIIKIKYLIY